MAGRFSRPLQPGESRWDMLQRLTTDETGNSVLSNAFPLAALVRITWNVERERLEQCVNIAIRNALYRLCMQAPHHGALHAAVVLVTMGDVLLALADMNP
jgi:hypothetical protein